MIYDPSDEPDSISSMTDTFLMIENEASILFFNVSIVKRTEAGGTILTVVTPICKFMEARGTTKDTVIV